MESGIGAWSKIWNGKNRKMCGWNLENLEWCWDKNITLIILLYLYQIYLLLSIGIILSHFSIISGRRPAGNTITITITSPLSGVFCPKPKRVNKLEDLIIAKLLTHPSVSQKQTMPLTFATTS